MSNETAKSVPIGVAIARLRKGFREVAEARLEANVAPGEPLLGLNLPERPTPPGGTNG